MNDHCHARTQSSCQLSTSRSFQKRGEIQRPQFHASFQVDERESKDLWFIGAIQLDEPPLSGTMNMAESTTRRDMANVPTGVVEQLPQSWSCYLADRLAVI